MIPKTIEWLNDRLRILDQTKLPQEQSFIDLTNYNDVVLAIKEMRVRGAPAIGIGAAYGIALGAQGIKSENKVEFFSQLDHILQAFSTSRPTAVNLFRAIDRMRKMAAMGDHIPEIKEALVNEARQIHRE